MTTFIKKWITLSFLSLLIVASLGMLLRYKIAFALPFVDQKNVLHSHSHFAFAGWVTQTLMVLMVHYLNKFNLNNVFRRYNWLLIANLVTAYGMMISFIFRGYDFISITFSTLSLLVSYFFIYKYWKDLSRIPKQTSHLWFKASFIFAIISSLGAYTLGFMTANHFADQHLYLAAIYFFLHFQYNGWFLFAGLGLFFTLYEAKGITNGVARIFWLFALPCIPGYLLSALWLPFPDWIYWLLFVAVIMQLAGWILLIRFLKQSKGASNQIFNRFARNLLLLSAIAFTIKLILQSGSIHPELSKLSYSFRPIVIGYLHLVLLAVTSIFLIGYITTIRAIDTNKIFKTGVIVFVCGIIINELLLMVQGIAALTYTGTPYINVMLLSAAFILFMGAAIMLISNFNNNENEIKHVVE